MPYRLQSGYLILFREFLETVWNVICSVPSPVVEVAVQQLLRRRVTEHISKSVVCHENIPFRGCPEEAYQSMLEYAAVDFSFLLYIFGLKSDLHLSQLYSGAFLEEFFPKNYVIT